MKTRMFVGSFAVVLALSAPVRPTGEGTPPPDRAAKSWVGVSKPSRTVSVGSERKGLIVEFPVEQGDEVRAGQVLFRLNDRREEIRARRLELLAKSDARVRSARARLAHAARERQRLVELARHEIVSDTEMAERDLTHQLAELELEQAELELENHRLEAEGAKVELVERTVRSPIDGIVNRKLHFRGETVNELEPALELVDLDPLWVEFDCPLQDAPLVPLGAEVRVRRAQLPDEVRTAVVVYFSAQADPSSHSFRVRLALQNRQEPWKAGVKMRIELQQ